MKRQANVGMTAHDLAELYSYLELFERTYDTCMQETEQIKRTVWEIYREDYGRQADAVETEEALMLLKNPRKAGRKGQIEKEEMQRIAEMYKRGKTIRTIAKETSHSKSTVQRILQRHR